MVGIMLSEVVQILSKTGCSDKLCGRITSLPRIMVPCAQITHIKALLLGFLGSSQLTAFETVMACSVRDPGFPDSSPSFLKESRLLVPP